MPERVPLNLKAPAKPLSAKERQARNQHAAEVLADQKRQAVEPSVVTKALPGPKLLDIAVPDTDDWTTFCAELLAAGQVQWYRQGDREARSHNNDPSVPRFTTWADFRKALLHVGERYWYGESTGATRSRRGRPDVLHRCWRAMMKEFIAARATGRLTYRKKDIVPLINSRPITQDEVQDMIRTGDHDPSHGAHNLSDKVCRKYGRLLYLAIKSRHQPLTSSDKAFQAKHLIPYFKKYRPDLAKEPLHNLTHLFSVSTSLISLM